MQAFWEEIRFFAGDFSIRWGTKKQPKRKDGCGAANAVLRQVFERPVKATGTGFAL